MADQDVPDMSDLAADLADETPDVKDEPVEETTPTESSPEETKETAEPVADGEPDAEAETEGDTEEETPEETPAEEEQPISKADERKAQLNTEIRDLVTQRRDLMQEVERLNNQVYSPQSVDDIMAETGQSQTDARLTAMEQQRELDRYNTQVAEAQLVIGSESQRVLQDFPMFDETSPDYKPLVAEQAAELLRSNLLVDPNTNQIIGSNISPYQLYKTIASANQVSAVENQLKGQKSAEKMLASAEPQSSASETKTVKEDPFLQGLTKGYGDRLTG